MLPASTAAAYARGSARVTVPQLPLRPCTHPGCGGLSNTGRCQKHPRKDLRQPSSQRGYGADWRVLRSTIPRPRWCPCGKELTSHLDHKVPREQGGTDDPSNLQWLGARCHSVKTASQDGGFGNPRNPLRRTALGT
jgi:5-methylcytosine-specific restriction protein A